MSFKKTLLIPVEMFDELLARPRPSEKDKTKKEMTEVLSNELPDPRDQLRMYNTLLNNYLHYQKVEKKEPEKEIPQPQPSIQQKEQEATVTKTHLSDPEPSPSDHTYTRSTPLENMDFLPYDTDGDGTSVDEDYVDVKPPIFLKKKKKKKIGHRSRFSTRIKKKPQQFGQGIKWFCMM
jgi:hypothetical protein